MPPFQQRLDFFFRDVRRNVGLGKRGEHADVFAEMKRLLHRGERDIDGFQVALVFRASEIEDADHQKRDAARRDILANRVAALKQHLLDLLPNDGHFAFAGHVERVQKPPLNLHGEKIWRFRHLAAQAEFPSAVAVSRVLLAEFDGGRHIVGFGNVGVNRVNIGQGKFDVSSRVEAFMRKLRPPAPEKHAVFRHIAEILQRAFFEAAPRA